MQRLEEKIDLSNSVFSLLHRAEQHAIAVFTEASQGLDVTMRQAQLLSAAAQDPGATQTALVARTGIDRSTVTELIGRMVARDLLRRRRSYRDSRAYELDITAEGLAVLHLALDAAQNAERQIFQSLTSAEQNHAKRILATLSNASAVST